MSLPFRLAIIAAVIVTSSVASRMRLAGHPKAHMPVRSESVHGQGAVMPPEGHFLAGMPATTNGERLTTFVHAAYSIGYSESRHTPVWSAYATFRTDQIGPTFGKYRPRWQPEGSAQPHDIEAYPWHRDQDPDMASVAIDKGHLTPLADIAYRYGLTAAEETFRMTNVVPQLAANNRGPWELLEASISGTNSNGRYMPGVVDAEGTLWVITGPIFSGTPSWSKGRSSLPSGVPIPSAMFKVIASGTADDPKVLCFVMPNEDLPKSMDTVLSSVTSLDAVERATGLNLFPGMRQDARARIGGIASTEGWDLRDNGRKRRR